MPQNISSLLTEQHEFGFALLHILNANFIAHTIDNIWLNILLNILIAILQHSPLLKGYALTFSTCTPPILNNMVCYCTIVLQILNFTGSLNHIMCIFVWLCLYKQSFFFFFESGWGSNITDVHSSFPFLPKSYGLSKCRDVQKVPYGLNVVFWKTFPPLQ